MLQSAGDAALRSGGNWSSLQLVDLVTCIRSDRTAPRGGFADNVHMLLQHLAGKLGADHHHLSILNSEDAVKNRLKLLDFRVV